MASALCELPHLRSLKLHNCGISAVGAHANTGPAKLPGASQRCQANDPVSQVPFTARVGNEERCPCAACASQAEAMAAGSHSSSNANDAFATEHHKGARGRTGTPSRNLETHWLRSCIVLNQELLAVGTQA